jgi:phosphomannomutase
MAAPFKAYDIRGIYPDDLNETLAEAIGNATAIHLGLSGKRFAVGRDMRVSSPMLKEAFIKGLLNQGVHVVDCGMLSTPGLTWAMHELATEGGTQITASHNPSEYGGLKITAPGYKPVGAGSGMEEIEALARAGSFSSVAGGTHSEVMVHDGYSQWLCEHLDLKRPLKIVVDGGNGIIGTMFQHLAPKLPGLEMVPLYFDPDGRFPYHDANPLKNENLTQLQAKITAEGADFGAAFDGDGDRCALVDGNGDIVTCDLVSALLGQALLATQPGATIAYDLRSSKVVPEMVQEWGGTPVETRVGHSYIKHTMKETGAIFAGELSGHYYFKDFFGADGGLYAFILLANLISANSSLAELVAPLQKYFHTGEINFKVSDTNKVFAALKAQPNVEVAELDGVTVRSSDWWCNVRASNTEPVVRLNLEADTAEKRDEQLKAISNLIESA